MTASRTSPLIGAVLGAGLLLMAGCTGSGPDQSLPQPLGELRLVAFDSCEQATQQLRAAAAAHVSPWGLSQPGENDLAMFEMEAERAQDAAGAAPNAAAPPDSVPDAAPGRGGPVENPEHSETNVHESGVDEPDLVKTDGRRIVTVTDGTLRVVDAQRGVLTGALDLRDPTPDEVGFASYWQPADLLMAGDRALVLMGDSWWGGMPVEPGSADSPALGSRPGPDQDPDSDPSGGPDILPAPPMPEPIRGQRVLLIDLSGEPQLLSEYLVDGSLVDARAVEGTARVVVRSGPRLAFPALDFDTSEQQRLAANRAVVENAEVTDWLPRYQVTTAGETSQGQVDCAAMSRPANYSGTSMLTVLTFDLSRPALGNGEPVSVVADGDTVYSNGRSLYVASDHRWRGPTASGAAERTELYKFDISQPGPPTYAAAGEVPGWLVNQYALSEWDDYLRVATTTGQVWGDDADSESAVYVLAERDGELVEVGSVGGLGKTERIYSVRFVGPIGYVVTFRETDPLYTVDLRDPTAPAVLGELKITGYSAYLHPLDEHRLIGVGQEADESGRTLGTQISVFDVSDLSNPSVLAQHHVEYGHSEAEFDPHAFLWWPAEQLLVIPLTVADWSIDRSGPPASGALLLRVDDDGEVTERDLISHPRPDGWHQSGQIRRSLVVGDTLWTVSDLGLQANALSTLQETAWVPFS